MGVGEYTDSTLVLMSIVAQELGAVFFNLICGSRLGDHDYYYGVTGDNSKYTVGADANYISNASLSSMFVLFLTLHVWNGPYLNFWLVSLDYVCVKSRTHEDDPKHINGFTKFLRLCAILVAHLIAVGLAYWLIPVTRDNFKSSMMWPEIVNSNRAQNMGYIFVEEVVAVSTLLVSFLYLAWVRPAPMDGAPSTFDIEFFIRLTLVVTGCKRAFPSAHLSPHVSTYLWFSGQVYVDEWATRVGSGIIASIVVIIWDKKVRQKTDGFDLLPDNEPKTASQNNTSATSDSRPSTPSTSGRPPTANSTVRPLTPAKPEANFGRGSSLSISFAKPGIYY